MDCQAISLVSALIARTKKAMPNLNANDTYPNIDGYIELADETGCPSGILKVQVKTLSEHSAQKRQYSFNDMKFLTYCKEDKDKIPIVLIGIDINNSKAFWLHIDKEYVKQLGERRTVQFSDEQVIDGYSTNFIDDWIKLVQSYHTQDEEYEKYEEYKQVYSMLSEIGTPATGLSGQTFENIHRFLDSYNNLLDNEFGIVKRRLYPGQWKIGFAYYKYGLNGLSYSMYPIPLNKNDVQIKQMNEDLHRTLSEHSLLFSQHFEENPIEIRPEQHAQDLIAQKMSKLLKNKLLDHTGSEFLVEEYIIAFVDRFHAQLGLSVKNEYTVNELEIEEPEMPRISIGQDKLQFRIYTEAFNFLKDNQNRAVKRQYIRKEYSRINDSGWIWNSLSKEQATHNLELLFDELPVVYDEMLETNFPLMKNKLSLFNEIDRIVIVYCFQDEYKRYEDHPAYMTFWLKAKEDEEDKSIDLTPKESGLKFWNHDWKQEAMEYDGKSYRITYISHAGLDFLYEDTPMLNYIYDLLTDKLTKYLGKDLRWVSQL